MRQGGSTEANDPAQTDGVLRRGNEVVTPEGPDLVAVDPDTGASRILLDREVSSDPLPTAVGGEAAHGRISVAAWSPDGRWLAFDGPDAALWVMNAEMEIRRLASADYRGWVWSPTEAQLAMILNSKLTVVDASTGRKIDLGDVVGDVTSAPVWSPDGTRILFGARGGSLYSVDVQSGERSMLVRLPGENLDSMDEIEWSPDGAQIAVMNDLEPGGGRLYVMNADGSGVRVLLDDYEPGRLAWSPDGESIAYVTYGDGAEGVWTISPAEGLPFAVAASTGISDPVWSPDGSRIAFVGRTADGLGWFAVDADGAGQRLEIDELTYLSWRGGPGFPPAFPIH
jgi:Tol biopolymer transport system component